MAETRVIAMKLEQAGVDAINCSQGIFTNSYNIVEPSSMENGAFVDNAEEIKKVVSMPVITAGSRSYNPLQTPLEEAGIPVRVVGDSLEVKNGLKGIYDGYMAGYEV